MKRCDRSRCRPVILLALIALLILILGTLTVAAPTSSEDPVADSRAPRAQCEAISAPSPAHLPAGTERRRTRQVATETANG